MRIFKYYRVFHIYIYTRVIKMLRKLVEKLYLLRFDAFLRFEPRFFRKI